MRKIILILACVFAASAFLSCKVDDSYSSKNIYPVQQLANTMAYKTVAVPVRALNRVDRSKTDIFAKDFELYDTLSNGITYLYREVSKDSCWCAKTISSNDNMIAQTYVVLSRDPKSVEEFWTFSGSCEYIENSSYSAVLTVMDVVCRWKFASSDFMDYIEYYLAADGVCGFGTYSGKSMLDKGTLILENQMTSRNTFEGTLKLY